ncbi:MAG: serpin family protein [Kofleriaceae bacterium]|nr:serpin family protein [Myxococcales bacterium]MCB9562897.1 serpin family protein [Kofleriaceae bacterium]
MASPSSPRPRRSRHRRAVVVVAAASTLLAVACGGGAVDRPPEVRSELPRDLDPAVSDADLAELVAGNTAFAADLYRAVRATPGNLFFSPHSISTALAMTYAGAEGDTAAQMAEVLHFTLPEPGLHQAFDRLDLELAARATDTTNDARPFRLHTANSIWGQQGWSFLPAFLDTLAVSYGAGLFVLDFAADPEGSRQTINAWVEDQTEDRIVDLLPAGSITDLTRLVLTNAIYFNASWAFPFDPDDTAARPFVLGDGTTVDVPTLHEVAELSYGVGPRFRAAGLPYDGGKLEMVVVLPEPMPDELGDPLPALEAELTAAKLDEIRASLHEAEVTLELPKFDFDAPLSLADTLAAMGMPSAFDTTADFSGIDGTRRLAISDVLHKGFVAIDETGTEAAAATAVVVGDTSVPEPATMIVDRPFLFFIVDRPTGAILFVGRIVDPR